MAHAISSRRHEYVGHWPDWPTSASAAHGRQHYCWASQCPTSTRFRRHTNEQTNERTDKQKDIAIA